MKMAWSEVVLGEVLVKTEDAVIVQSDKSYPNLGVYGHGRGSFTKVPISGASTSAHTLFRVRAGQFIYSRLFAFEGAYAVVQEAHDGFFVSNEFPSFELDQLRLLPGFLRAYFRRPSVWNDLASQSTGLGNRRQRIHPEVILAHRIPLPPLAEQQRLVAHLDAIESRLTRAKMLREEAARESHAFVRSLIHPDNCAGVKLAPMHELVACRSPDVVVSQSESYPFAGVYSFGRGVFRKETVSGMDFAYERLTRLRAGEFTYPKLMAWEGALGVVPPECDGYHVSPEFPVFTVNESKVLPDILDIYFKTPSVWNELAAISTGTNLRRRRLNPSAFLGYKFPLPPMEAQQHAKCISARAVEKRVLQHESESMERALFPSLLDRIFNP